jgi:glycosyltransferase involved in cell wall biosynthesis
VVEKCGEITATVLLCAYNEEAFLPRTLETLLSQDVDFAFEIVVVDNNSTDRTAAIAGNYNVNVVSCELRGKIPALKAGLLHSCGGIVAIADADTEYPSNWLSAIVRTFTFYPKTVLVFGGTFAELSNALTCRIMGAATDLFIRLSLHAGVVCSIGFNLAVRREALINILQNFDHYAYTGWAIGTRCHRRYGASSIVYLRSLRVPKCMRRYDARGYLHSIRRWVVQWLRLLMRREMNLMEAEYFGFDEISK